VHRLKLREDPAATQANPVVGHQVRDIARQLYDNEGKGDTVDPQMEGFGDAVSDVRHEPIGGGSNIGKNL
jgi:hypothetical protein